MSSLTTGASIIVGVSPSSVASVAAAAGDFAPVLALTGGGVASVAGDSAVSFAGALTVGSVACVDDAGWAV